MNELHVGVCRNEAAGCVSEPEETITSVSHEMRCILEEQENIIIEIGGILFGEKPNCENGVDTPYLFAEMHFNRKLAVENLKILKTIRDRLGN